MRLCCVYGHDEWRTCSMTDYDPTREPPRDPRVPPGAQPQPAANQTVVRSGGSSSLVIAAVVVAILVILFLVFGGGAMFSGSDPAVDETSNTETTVVPGSTSSEPAAPAGTPAPTPQPAAP